MRRSMASLADGPRLAKTSQAVAEMIVRDITTRGLTTGSRLLPEAQMLREYRVGRASLREALRLLEVEGLITMRRGPGGGPVVGRVDALYLARTISLYFHLGGMKYADIFATQQVLEPACAQLAAQHPDRARAMTFHAGVEAPSDGPIYHAMTADFHADIYRLAGNGVLTLISRAVTTIVTTHIVSTMDPVELHASILEDHREMAKAILAGQGDTASRLTADHFRRQHEYYRERWPACLEKHIEWR